jgi:hypothetical protein
MSVSLFGDCAVKLYAGNPSDIFAFNKAQPKAFDLKNNCNKLHVVKVHGNSFIIRLKDQKP